MPRRARPASVIAALVAIVAGGCSAISGLDDLRFHGDDATSSGGASGGGDVSSTHSTGGASSGGGGAGGCDAAADCPVAEPCHTRTCKEHRCRSPVAADHVPCAGSTGNMVCDDGKCVGCVDNTDCTAPKTCGGAGVANACGCTVGLTCAMLDQTCGTVDDGCGSPLDCDDAKRDGSETDTDCGGPVATCPTRCPVGKHCTIASDCAANAAGCEQGFCCSTVCNTACHSCGFFANHGTCSVFPQGEQQAGLCDDTNGGCNGQCACGANGFCKLKSGEECASGTQCASGSCTGGVCD